MIIMDRRTILRGTAALGTAAFISGCTGQQAPAVPGRFFERIGKPIGLQLYALGEEAANDPGATFAMVRAMGFGEAELPNLYGREASEIRALADAAGLPVSSLHVPAVPFSPGAGPTFMDDPDEIAAIASTLGVDQLVIPFPILPEGFAIGDGESFPDAISRAFSGARIEHWQATAQRFNEIGQAMKDRGIALAYHNHNVEFAPLGETTPWQVLISETDPELVKLQLDLGWVSQAGLDPETVLRAMGPRVTSLHVKDVSEGGEQSFFFGATPTEVGSGRLDWASILPAAEEVGVAHYFVEQEPPFTMPRNEAAAKSLQFLQALEA